MDSPYTHHCVIQLHHTDAAGVVFFARLFTLAHDAYQAFMAARGLPLRAILEDTPYLLPVVHAEADLAAPLRVDDAVAIEVTVERLGEGSFTLGYAFRRGDGVAAATARTVHAAIARHGATAIPLPADLRAALGAP